MKKAWVLYNESLNSPQYQQQLQLYVEGGADLNIDVSLHTTSSLGAGIVNHRFYLRPHIQEALSSVDFVLFLDKDILLGEQLLHMGCHVSNPPKSIGLCDNKIATFQALAEHGLPLPDTLFAPLSFDTGHKKEMSHLEPIITLLGLPLVIKEAYGSFGQQVYLANTREEVITICNNIGNKPYLYQRYIKSSHGRDVRVYVVGGQVVGGMGRENEGDFRANITSGGRMYRYEVGGEVGAVAIKASKVLGLDFCGVDIMFGEGGEPILCEVNSNAHIKNYYDAFGQNLARDIWAYLGGTR